MLDLRAVAHALGGTVSGRRIVAPGPGHTRADRSLSIEINPGAPDGFLCHSFAGDDWRECRDYVRQALGLGAWEQRRRRSGPCRPVRAAHPIDHNTSDRTTLALCLWNEAHDPRDTLAEVYLASRGLMIGKDVAGEVIRFHPKLKFDRGCVGAMVALFCDIVNDEPCGIHRTFLDSEGRKLNRWMLGRASRAAIKLDGNENVSLGLTIGEGVETCLAAQLAGFRPSGRSVRQAPLRRFRCCPGSRRSRSSARLMMAVQMIAHLKHVRLDGLRQERKLLLLRRLLATT